MKAMSRITLAVFFALLVSPPLSAQDSLVRIPWASGPPFEAYLPPLPADIPWLDAARRNSVATYALPEGRRLEALFWLPSPLESWSTPPASQSATAATVSGG